MFYLVFIPGGTGRGGLEGGISIMGLGGFGGGEGSFVVRLVSRNR